MTRQNILLAAALLSVVFVCGLRAGERISNHDFYVKAPAQGEMKLRVMEGLREGAGNAVRAVTASYPGSMTTIGYLSDADLSAEQEQIRKTFNLKEVRLLTEADLVWAEGKAGKTSHTFRLDGREYVIKLTPGGVEPRQPFGIEVLERTEKGETSLLDTGFGLLKTANRPIVFGFENSQGRPFFVCLHAVSMMADEAGANVEAVAASMAAAQAAAMAEAAEKVRRLEEFNRGAVPCTGDIQPPELVKLVEPVYPEDARVQGMAGIVILAVKTGEDGTVIDAMVLRSIPGLDDAAIATVKQWVYEPMIIEGKAVKALFTVTVRFTLEK